MPNRNQHSGSLTAELQDDRRQAASILDALNSLPRSAEARHAGLRLPLYQLHDRQWL
jgi:hypothetical protein